MKAIFERPLDRSIEGVIKADDDAGLRAELEEYVITNEIERQLERFLEAYNNYKTANGVWISGFFGSGKSHLLKMLALILENRDVEGQRAYDLFKEKCRHNEILAADLRRAVELPSKSILFNIDQKADVISKDQVDALLSVFQKVFDEMCGYYGKQAYIAQFERDLDGRGLFQEFRAAFQAESNQSWERGREQALLEGDRISRAYCAVTGASAEAGRDILGQYRKDYKSSIEDFAERVNTYIEAQGPKFRLNFFVDEVGQYIAENVKLMTNLQTVAESLNTKCRGRAWIIVTAQQDMDAVVGDRTQMQQNDFSKIQARFANRIPLNSADVAEVIQRRLLTKTEAGIQILEDLYHQQSGNLKTLFDFADGSRQLKNFNDRDHFVRSYPFIPYQYTLFQQAIQNLSQHNAFEGKNSSVGERSMLAVFQDASVRLADVPVGGLATFDLMYEGISPSLKSNVQQSILVAKANLDDEFAVRVLKSLFLVKYVKDFKPTTRNIGILLQNSFDLDPTKHRRRIEEALALLEQNTYIQRNGEIYEFLTDEEKDVEQDIKSLDIDHTEITAELKNLIFDTVLKNRKIKHERSAQDFAYSQMLDDRLMGREYELKINIITPFYTGGVDENAIRMGTLAKDELVVVLGSDVRLVSDLMLYKKTEKYVRQTNASAAQPAIARIIQEKGQLNGARQKELTTKLRQSLAEAKLFVRGADLELRGDDPQVRIEKAFQTLVEKTHTSLPMLQGDVYVESDIGKFLKQGKTSLAGLGEVGLQESEQEILNLAQSNLRTGVRTTVKAITEKFESKPYGWSYHAILALTAGLLGKGKIEAKLDGAVIEGDALEKALKNSSSLANLVIDLQAEFTANQVKRLRTFYSDLFDAQPAASDGKALALEMADTVTKMIAEIKVLIAQADTYPFLASLPPFLTRLQTISGKPYGWYLQDLGSEHEVLIDEKDAILAPIRLFMAGQQKTTFDDAATYLEKQDANFSYVGTDRSKSIRAGLQNPECLKGNLIQQIKQDLDALRLEVTAALVSERGEAGTEIAAMADKLYQLEEWSQTSATQRAAIEAVVSKAQAGIAAADLIAVIRQGLSQFRDVTYPTLLDQATRPVTPPPPPAPSPSGGLEERPAPTPPAPPKEPPATYVAVRNVKVAVSQTDLRTNKDVDDYVETLRQALKSELAKGKRISL